MKRGKSPIPVRDISNDRSWEAKDYARTLAEAEEIRSNPEKLALAKMGAREMLNEQNDRRKGLEAVVNGRDSYSDIADKRGYVNPATIAKM